MATKIDQLIIPQKPKIRNNIIALAFVILTNSVPHVFNLITNDIANNRSIRPGTIEESNVLHAKKVDYMPHHGSQEAKSILSRDKYDDKKSNLTDKPTIILPLEGFQEFGKYSDTPFFQEINKIQKQTGIEVYFEQVPEGVKDNDTKYFSQDTLDNVKNLTATLSQVNSLANTKIPLVRGIKYSFGGKGSASFDFLAYADVEKGVIAVSSQYWNMPAKDREKIMRHEITHVIFYRLGLLYISQNYSENSVFLIKYFLPEYKSTESFYNDHLQDFKHKPKDIKEYAFVNIAGTPVELGSVIIEKLPEIYKPKDSRDEVAAQRVLRTFGLFKYTFGNLPISNPDSWKVLLSETLITTLSQEDKNTIDKYAAEVGDLQVSIRNKVDNQGFQFPSNSMLFDNERYAFYADLQETKMICNIIGIILSIVSLLSFIRNSIINKNTAERYLYQILDENEIGETENDELGSQEQVGLRALSKKMLNITKAYLFGYASLEKFITELKKILDTQGNST